MGITGSHIQFLKFGSNCQQVLWINCEYAQSQNTACMLVSFLNYLSTCSSSYELQVKYWLSKKDFRSWNNIKKQCVHWKPWMPSMDKETVKTPISKCRLYWCFCLGWCSSFVGSESGRKQSVKLLQNMAYNSTKRPPPSHPPSTATHCTVCIYCTFTLGRGEGWGRSERR